METGATMSLWWLHPFWIVPLPLMVVSLIAYLLPEPDYRENWRMAKTFGASDLGLCFAVAAAFSAGCVLASRIDASFSTHRRLAPGPRDIKIGQRELKILFDVFLLVTLAGYFILLGSIVKQGGLGLFKSLLGGGQGSAYEIRALFKDSIISGVTTITQFGMGVALLGIYLGFTQGWRKIRLRLALLFAMTAVRAIFLSERLSLIEVVLPSVILTIRLIGFGQPGSLLRRFLLIAPVVGVGGLYTLFTFTEYFRSWASFYEGRGDQSLFSFSLLRLLGYYVTALNNGAIEWHEHGALYFPYSTLDWLWNFPVVGRALKQSLGGTDAPSEVRDALLTADGNLELSNPSGIFVVFTDLGVTGALFYFACFGCLAGLFYGSYRRGSISGLFMYSFLFTGMTEQVRIIYLTTGRVLPTWLLLIAAIFVTRPALRLAASIRKPAWRTPPVPVCDDPPT